MYKIGNKKGHKHQHISYPLIDGFTCTRRATVLAIGKTESKRGMMNTMIVVRVFTINSLGCGTVNR